MNTNMSIGIGEGLLYSLLGILVVFFALVLLMCIIKLMWVFERKDKSGAVEVVPAGIAGTGTRKRRTDSAQRCAG